MMELLLDLLRTPPVTVTLTLLVTYGLYKAFRRREMQSQQKEQENKKQEGQNDSETSSNSSDDYIDEGSYSKLVLIVRNDLKMGKGKVAAQCAHAAVAAYKQARKHPNLLRSWEQCGQTKITLRCDNEIEMMELYKTAKAVGILSYVVRDAGQTQVAPGSKTVCSVGPGPCEIIDQITGHLKLY